jgi:hypothetical protein
MVERLMPPLATLKPQQFKNCSSFGINLSVLYGIEHEHTGAVMMADYVFWPVVALTIGCSLYCRARIKSDRIVIQWGVDGGPTWSAPKAVGLWFTVVLALFLRLVIWAAMTYLPQTVHGAEPGLLIGSIVLAVAHGILLVAALRSDPSS